MANAAPITVDGNLNDWTAGDRIDRGLGTGYAIYARSDGADFAFAITAPAAIGANTTAWLNTDRNATTGYQVFGFAGGAEYNVNFAADGTVSLYSGAAGQTLVASGLQAAWSADRTTVEFKVPKAAIGNPQAIDTIYDVNDTAFLPGNYSNPAFTVFNDTGIVADPSHRIAIVWSDLDRQRLFQQDRLFAAVHGRAVPGDAGGRAVRHPDRGRPDQPGDARQIRHDRLPVVPQRRGEQGRPDRADAGTGDQAVRHRPGRGGRVHDQRRRQ
ncbi:hypothetical protein [Sphingomonas sp. LR55]|uniref:hypothetical protein n=1 Tax=Sphingomonas sp. LR55 TaxID=3050231 RepID=UPI002FE3C66B